MTNANGHIGNPLSTESRPRPETLDRSTQTDPTQDTGQERVPPPRRAQSLHLEDALPPVEGTRAKLHRVPGLEEDDDEQDEDEEAGVEQEKELSWTSSVEEPIQPTTIRDLQREDCQDRSCSPEDPGSVRTPDQNMSPRSGPLAPIQEVEKTALCVTSSSPLHDPPLSSDWFPGFPLTNHL